MKKYGPQQPTSTIATTAGGGAGEEEMRASVVDTSGFGMYTSGTGTGAITGGGMLPDESVTTATAIQSQLPCSPAPAGYCSVSISYVPCPSLCYPDSNGSFQLEHVCKCLPIF